MPRNPLHQRLISIVEPVCQAAGYELIDLRFVLEQGGWTLRVAIDRFHPSAGGGDPDGSAGGAGGLPRGIDRPVDEHTDPDEVPSDRVSLIDCENLSRELSAVLDVEDPIPQAFHLEISSPGIDRPLRTAEHFRHFAGSEAKIQLAVPLHTATGERRNFRGTLHGFDGDAVVIECDGAEFRLALDDIDHARLVPDWDAVMKGKSGVGKAAGKAAARPAKPGHRPSRKSPPQGVSAAAEGSDADKER